MDNDMYNYSSISDSGGGHMQIYLVTSHSHNIQMSRFWSLIKFCNCFFFDNLLIFEMHHNMGNKV